MAHSAWQKQYNSVVELKVDGLINTDEDANNIGALKFAIRFGSGGFISISADQFQEGCEDG